MLVATPKIQTLLHLGCAHVGQPDCIYNFPTREVKERESHFLSFGEKTQNDTPTGIYELNKYMRVLVLRSRIALQNEVNQFLCTNSYSTPPYNRFW